MLTPQQISEMDKLTGLQGSASQTHPNTNSRLAELDALDAANESGLRKAGGVAKDLAIGVGKGLASTAQTVAKPITSILPQMTDVKTGQPIQKGFSKQELEPTNTAQSIGKGTEQVAEFFAPGTAGMKVAKGAGILAKAGVEALSAGGVNLAQTGTKEGGIEGAALGAVSPVVGKTLSFITKGIAKNAAGALAKGTNILDSVLDNPKAALEGLNMPAEEVFKKDVGLIKTAVTDSYKKAKNAYSAGITQLDKEIPRVDKGLATPYIESALDKFGVKVNKGVVDTTESPLSDIEKSTIQKVVDLVSTTQAKTPSEIDALAQKVSKFERDGADAVQVNSIIRGIKKGLRQSIIDSAPEGVKEVAENIASNYAKSMDKLDLYQQLFKVSKDKFMSEVERANATNKLKNLFSGDKAVENQTLKDLGLEDILSRQAGRVSGAEDISRAQTGLGDLLKTAVNVVFTPKTITNIAAHLKMGADAVSSLAGKSKTVEEFISGLPRGLQGAALQFLHDQED